MHFLEIGLAELPVTREVPEPSTGAVLWTKV